MGTVDSKGSNGHSQQPLGEEPVSAEVSVNGIKLHVTRQGVGPVVVLLHGFPEYSACWRPQMAALAAAGYCAVAPDMRGYHLSEKPESWREYTLPTLVEDIAALIRHESPAGPIAALVGHDWGGMVAWQLAGKHPELLERLAILNALPPHRAQAKAKPLQLLKSWYVFAFQLPWLPEFMLTRRGMLGSWLRWSAVNKAAFDAETLRDYENAMRIEGAARGTVNYYRALLRQKPEPEGAIDCPTRVIWGVHDRFLTESVLDGLWRTVPNIERIRLQVGHWVQSEAPGEVNRHLLDLLAVPPQPPPSSATP